MILVPILSIALVVYLFLRRRDQPDDSRREWIGPGAALPLILLRAQQARERKKNKS